MTDPLLNKNELTELTKEINSQKINVNIEFNNLNNDETVKTSQNRIPKLGLNTETNNLILIDVVNLENV